MRLLLEIPNSCLVCGVGAASNGLLSPSGNTQRFSGYGNVWVSYGLNSSRASLCQLQLERAGLGLTTAHGWEALCELRTRCWRQLTWPDTRKDCEVLMFSAGKSLGSANYLLNNKSHQTAFNILWEGKCIYIIFNKAKFKQLQRKRKGYIQNKGRFSTSNPSLCLLWILSHCKTQK